MSSPPLSILELARKCIRSDTPITVAKMDAAQEQLEGAIYNLFYGNWACAVTLACAAEGMLETNEEGDDLFSIAKKLGTTDVDKNGRKIADYLNDLPHWLKHKTPNKSGSYSICQWDAVQAVLRALSKLVVHQPEQGDAESASENVHAFQVWYVKNYPELIETNELPK